MLVEKMSIEEEYIPGEIVGEGAFGKVRTARRKSDDTLVVIKEVSMANMSSKEKEDALTEVKILEDLDHTNIIQYHDCRIDGNTLCIVMEYAEEGELHTLIKSKGEKEEYFPESQILAWFVQLCLGLGHVHSKKILHRDLKSQNIFRTKNNILKLGDFGIAKVLNSETQMASTAIGTPYYLSPEICEDKPYGTKSDMWALGCVLYELCSLKRAFDGASLPALVLKILRGKYPPLPGHYSKELRELVCSLLQRKPDNRPSIKKILEMPNMREHIKTYMSHITTLANERTALLPAGVRPLSAQLKRPPGVKKTNLVKNQGKARRAPLIKEVKNEPPPTLQVVGGRPPSSHGRNNDSVLPEEQSFLSIGTLAGEEGDDAPAKDDAELSMDLPPPAMAAMPAREPARKGSAAGTKREASRKNPSIFPSISPKAGAFPDAEVRSRGASSSPNTEKIRRTTSKPRNPNEVAALQMQDPEWQRKNAEIAQAKLEKKLLQKKKDEEQQVELQKRAAMRQREREKEMAKATEAEQERRRRNEEKEIEFQQKEEEKRKIREAEKAQAAKHREGLKAAKPRMTRQELMKMGKQFAEKQSSGNHEWQEAQFIAVVEEPPRNTPSTPSTSTPLASPTGVRTNRSMSSHGSGSDRVKAAPARSRSITSEEKRRIIISNKTKNKGDVAVEIYCPVTEAEAAKVARLQDEDAVAEASECPEMIETETGAMETYSEDDFEDDEGADMDKVLSEEVGTYAEGGEDEERGLRGDMEVLTQLQTLLDGDDPEATGKLLSTIPHEVGTAVDLTSTLGPIGEKPMTPLPPISLGSSNASMQRDEENESLGAKIEELRQLCEEKLGEETLLRIYRYLRDHSNGAHDSGGDEQQDWLNRELGPEKIQYAQHVFRLIMYEDQYF